MLPCHLAGPVAVLKVKDPKLLFAVSCLYSFQCKKVTIKTYLLLELEVLWYSFIILRARISAGLRLVFSLKDEYNDSTCLMFKRVTIC